jgi:hypothetical protein
MHSVNKNTQPLAIASKETGLEVNVMSGNQNAGQNSNIKIGNKFFLKAAVLQIFGHDPNESKFHS